MTRFLHFAQTALLFVASVLSLSLPTLATETKPYQEIAENIYSYSTDGGYISMFAITAKQVVVFETMNSTHAKGMLATIRSLTDKPIKYAFQSHNHWDHASGGQVFLDNGAQTIAHAEAARWMAANPYPDMVMPSMTWQGKLAHFEVDELDIELHYFGMNHGLGMTVFYFPKQKLVYLADIVTPNRVIFSVVPDFNLREWERSLHDVLALNFTKAVFSHNEYKNYLAAGNRDDVQAQLDYLRDLRQAFYQALKEGTNPMLIPSTLKLPKYENWVGYKEWLPMNVWRILADEFMGPFPWHPDETAK